MRSDERTRIAGTVVAVCAVGLGLTACGSPSPPKDVAVFTMRAGPSRLIPLRTDIPVIEGRLRSLGDSGATVVVQGNSVAVRGGGPLPAPPSFFVRTGDFSLRAVLCGAPPLMPHSSVTPPTRSALPPCGAAYATTAANLSINPNSSSQNGYTFRSVGADPVLASYPSTPEDDADAPSTPVLLSADPATGAQQYPRFVLGPVQFREASTPARAVFDTTINAWTVAYTVTQKSQYDRATRSDFHRYMALDMDGEVLSAPIIQPTEAAFSSFEGRGEISGVLTKKTAGELAALLTSGPLRVPLAAG